VGAVKQEVSTHLDKVDVFCCFGRSRNAESKDRRVVDVICGKRAGSAFDFFVCLEKQDRCMSSKSKRRGKGREEEREKMVFRDLRKGSWTVRAPIVAFATCMTIKAIQITHRRGLTWAHRMTTRSVTSHVAAMVSISRSTKMMSSTPWQLGGRQARSSGIV
jgi:hypothetical protein